MIEDRPCAATTKAGKPCSNPAAVGDLCYAHDPGTRARNAAKATKAADARKAALARHITPEQVAEVGPIETAADVKRAADMLFRWTVGGDLDAKACGAAVQALRLLADVVKDVDLEGKLQELEAALNGTPTPTPLRAVRAQE